MEESTKDLAIFKRLLDAAQAKNPSEFARLMKLSPQAVAKARAKGKIPPAWIPQAARLFGVSTDWLFFGNETSEPKFKEHCTSHSTEGYNELVMIPRVNARLCAGTGSLETEASVIGMYAFRSDWILRKGNPEKMVLMDITGDSMEPEIKHGDIVLIDQGKVELIGYGYYAVGIEDAIYVKEISTLPGKLVLHSLNQRYQDIEVNLTEEQPLAVRIIGRVLWVGRELD